MSTWSRGSSDAVKTAVAAQLLGVSRWTVQRLCRAGDLEGAYQPARRGWLIPLRSVQARIPTAFDTGSPS